MAAQLGALVQIEGEKSAQWRPPASWQYAPPPKPAIELDDLHKHQKYGMHNVPRLPSPAKTTPELPNHDLPSLARDERGRSTPATPSELEMSRPSSPHSAEVSTVKQSWSSPRMNRWRVLAACLVNFAGGANDSAPGALLPYIEQYYKIDYAIVSMIFVTNAIGFIAASCIVQLLDSKLGRAKTSMLCEITIAIGYVMMIIPPPYPLFAIR